MCLEQAEKDEEEEAVSNQRTGDVAVDVTLKGCLAP